MSTQVSPYPRSCRLQKKRASSSCGSGRSAAQCFHFNTCRQHRKALASHLRSCIVLISPSHRASSMPGGGKKRAWAPSSSPPLHLLLWRHGCYDPPVAQQADDILGVVPVEPSLHSGQQGLVVAAPTPESTARHHAQGLFAQYKFLAGAMVREPSACEEQADVGRLENRHGVCFGSGTPAPSPPPAA